MDPIANLNEQARIRARIKSKSTIAGDYGRLRELRAALREWLARGGLDPRVTFARERLNRDGYTFGEYGRYFGQGAPLYRVTFFGEEPARYGFMGTNGMFVRASDRSEARAIIAADLGSTYVVTP